MSKVWAGIDHAAVVLADVTGFNPNVMYELGLAHAAAKPVVLVSSDRPEDLAFDIAGLGVHFYDVTVNGWHERLISTLADAIQESLENPRSKVLPAFLNVRPRPVDVTSEEAVLLKVNRKLDSILGALASGRPGPPAVDSGSEMDTLIRNATALARADYFLDAWEETGPAYLGATDPAVRRLLRIEMATRVQALNEAMNRRGYTEQQVDEVVTALNKYSRDPSNRHR